MTFFDYLNNKTAAERDYLQSSPIIFDCLRGEITRAQYVSFLKEAYFHVKQTVPLLMACGSCLKDDHEWLRGAVAHYIDDEYGHEQWILDDIRACGVDPEAVRNDKPSLATELMVSYAWDMIHRVNPVGFFGMVYVLEGTSVALATAAANTIQEKLELPDTAFRYLLSHGSIDQDHIRFLEDLLNKIEAPADCSSVVHSAQRFFYLYAQIFRTLPDKVTAESRFPLSDAA